MRGKMLKMGFKAMLGQANTEIETVSAKEAANFLDDRSVQFVDVRETQEVENV